ncbi:MAG: tRNA uridine-5-carboxymethylaminomethyl(34) synthesis GTPase MnmE, partial [Gammaproteobacteria bacterium]
LARPGEFTERAFLNDKLDLLQAEAIADLIDASSRQAARLAIRTLKGEFSSQIHQLVAQLVAVRVNVEAAIDFSDEDIDVLADSKAITKLEQVKSSISQTLATAEQGAMLMHGIHLVLAGAPNAGKSSLLNALSGQDSAIVTDIPGTTRDLLSHHILIGDLPVHITDTAGLRDSADIVEREGVRRALQAIDEADMVLLMVDQSNLESGSEDPTRLLGNNNQSAEYLQTLLAKTVVIANKIDLLGDQPELDSIELQGIALPRIFLSAKTGAGLDLLKTHLQQAAGLQESSQSVFVARERHLVALRAALALVGSALDLLQKGEALELCAEDLRLAQQRLGEITGEFTSDDLLGEIFSQFCVGK